MKTPFWLYVISLVPSAMLAAIGAAQPWVLPAELFRDPLAVAMDVGTDCCHVYFGFFSNLGVLLWCSAASVCLFASMLLIQRKADRHQILFLVSAGIFTGLLLFDDSTQRQPNISLAKEKLSWTPTVFLDEGLMKTIKYFDALLSGNEVPY